MDATKLKAVVFDCDGVMFDTAFANRKYYDEVLELFGKTAMNDEQFKNVHMMTVTESIAYLFPESDDLSGIFKGLQGIGYHKFIEHMVMEKGLKQLLDGLKEKGFIRCVATNRTNTMEKVLEIFDLEKYFDMVVTAAKVKKPKPDPEQLLMIMDEYSLKPDEVLFIGDTEYDSRAAAGAKTFFIAFKNNELEADYNVESMDEIARLLLLK
jgi:phosphoglycolate phosphatase